MTEYEQFQQFFQQHGVPYQVLTDATGTYEYRALPPEGRSQLVTWKDEFWFDAAGRFIGMRDDDYETWKPREDSV